MKHKIDRELGQALQAIEPLASKEQIEETKRKVNGILEDKASEVYEAKIGFTEFFLRQLKFLSVPIWIVQGTVLILLLLTLEAVYGMYTIQTEKQLAKLLGGSAMVVFITTIPFIQRSIRYRMNIVEMATRFSFQRLLLCRILTIGVGDVMILAGITMISAKYIGITILQSILYFAVPFLLLTAVMLYLMRHIAFDKYLTASVSLCVIAAVVFYLVGNIFPMLFRDSMLSFWVVTALIFLVGTIWQIYDMVTRSIFTELQMVQ